jgi:CRP-like cAMP-binding protein
MLSMIEKVLVLRGVSIFAGTPDEVLAQLAPLLDEVEVPARQTVINKGDIGTCMYIIAEGRLRVRDRDRVINEIVEGEVFGEMAVLDPAPRSASVTALEDARLLHLDQEPFYELMADHVEVAQGVIQVLARRLRALLQDAPNVPATPGPPYVRDPLTQTQTQTPATPTGDMEGGLHATH